MTRLPTDSSDAQPLLYTELADRFHLLMHPNDYAEDAADAGRALRYLEWTWDPDPPDDEIVTDFAYLLRQRDGSTRALHDRHRFGLFPRATWLELIWAAGFAEAAPRDTPIGSQPFVARRPR
jgi:hypothetical protein